MSTARRRKEQPGVGLEGLTIREVTADRWADMERLFEGSGGPKYCWCMAWRPMAREARTTGGSAARKAAMAEMVQGGTPVGILAYLGEEPVAWCSVAPRETYRPLGGLQGPGEGPGDVWSLACFFIPRHLRGQGLMHRLIRAAVEHARARGAKAVEAYPVDPDAPSYRFMGFVSAFQAAGFREVGRAGSRRHVMRLSL